MQAVGPVTCWEDMSGGKRGVSVFVFGSFRVSLVSNLFFLQVEGGCGHKKARRETTSLLVVVC